MSHRRSPSNRILLGMGSLWLETKAVEPRIIGLAEQLQAFDMSIKHAGCKKTGATAHARTGARRYPDSRRNRGKLASPERAKATLPTLAPARLARPDSSEADVVRCSRSPRRALSHRCSGSRGNPRLRRNAHRDILVRIAQRTWLVPRPVAENAGSPTSTAKGRKHVVSSSRNSRDCAGRSVSQRRQPAPSAHSRVARQRARRSCLAHDGFQTNVRGTGAAIFLRASG